MLVVGNSETTQELLKADCEWPEAHVLYVSSVTLGGVRSCRGQDARVATIRCWMGTGNNPQLTVH